MLYLINKDGGSIIQLPNTEEAPYRSGAMVSLVCYMWKNLLDKIIGKRIMSATSAPV
jgi:hypothetical protein